MAMIRCKADLHFFDRKKHETCPYCERLKEGKQQVLSLGETDDTCSAQTVIIGADKKKPPPGVPASANESHAAVETLVESAPSSSPTEPIVQRESAAKEEKQVPGGAPGAPLEQNASFSPVVGWLVCTHGPERGKDFRIRAGINEIGRDEDPEVDIVIKGDDAISKRYHAQIQYDLEENAFYLIRLRVGAVKVNDASVRRPVTLNPYDVVLLGETKFIFIPLCSDRFQWPDGA